MGKLLETLMNMVVSTSIADGNSVKLVNMFDVAISQNWRFLFEECFTPVKLTVTTASKKKGLKKLVACPMMFKRTVGR